MPTDLDIARTARLRPIQEIAGEAGIPEASLSPYGRYIAKVDPALLPKDSNQGKLILVTAITPTPAGEGKTTVSVALADGLHKTGRRVMMALREPSLGPVFGMKGGATGGGYAQVLPMEQINLHFTGDLHAITAANNLLCAMIDNHIHQGNELGIDGTTVCFRHCLDVNDRQLRQIVAGLGGTKNGAPREDGFDITAASEVMATFCLASDVQDLKARLGRIVVARSFSGEAVTCAQVGANGAMTALLKDALMPNLVQSIEGTPCLMHGGPFANIAHGCNSVAATKAALSLADYVVTEAGFGADLGAEKFLDIKCRLSGLWPHAVVLVCTARALKSHGGVGKAELGQENVAAVKAGLCNLHAHLENIAHVWQLPVVVAINRFSGDTEAELRAIEDDLGRMGVRWALCEGWAKGGAGATALADTVAEAAEHAPLVPSYTYPSDAPLKEKITAIATQIYGAGSVTFAAGVESDLKRLEADGYQSAPVCIAKTQYSLSDNKALLGAPHGYALTIRRVRLSAGAGFVVCFAGDIIAMPGLGRHPAAMDIDVDEHGQIVGLF